MVALFKPREMMKPLVLIFSPLWYMKRFMKHSTTSCFSFLLLMRALLISSISSPSLAIYRWLSFSPLMHFSSCSCTIRSANLRTGDVKCVQQSRLSPQCPLQVLRQHVQTANSWIWTALRSSSCFNSSVISSLSKRDWISSLRTLRLSALNLMPKSETQSLRCSMLYQLGLGWQMMRLCTPKSWTSFLATAQFAMIMNSSTSFSLSTLFFKPMLIGKFFSSSSNTISFLSKKSALNRSFLRLKAMLFNSLILLDNPQYSLSVSSFFFIISSFFIISPSLSSFSLIMLWASSQVSWAMLFTTVFSNLESRMLPQASTLKSTLKASLRFLLLRAHRFMISQGIMWIVLCGRYIDVPLCATYFRFIRCLKEVTSEMWMPTSNSPFGSSYRERPSSISREPGGSMVKTIQLNSRWFLIGRYSQLAGMRERLKRWHSFWKMSILQRMASVYTYGVLKLQLKRPVIVPLGQDSSQFHDVNLAQQYLCQQALRTASSWKFICSISGELSTLNFGSLVLIGNPSISHPSVIPLLIFSVHNTFLPSQRYSQCLMATTTALITSRLPFRRDGYCLRISVQNTDAP